MVFPSIPDWKQWKFLRLSKIGKSFAEYQQYAEKKQANGKHPSEMLSQKCSMLKLHVELVTAYLHPAQTGKLKIDREFGLFLLSIAKNYRGGPCMIDKTTTINAVALDCRTS